MGAFGLLALLSGLLMGLAFDFNDGAEGLNDSDTLGEPDIPEEDPDVMLDTGATFDHTEEGVEIDVGEDETGTLVVIYYTDPEDNPDGILDADEARFYLVPEGVDWSSTSWETRWDVPGADEYGGSSYEYELADFETQFGLELLGIVDLTGLDGEANEPASRFGGIISNEPIEEYYLQAQTDGDELISFLPVDYVITRDGVSEVSVITDTTGTDAIDWLSADADGITVDGAGGDDYLETSNANVTLIGGLGDDVISSSGLNVVVDAGDGDDRVTAYGGNAMVDGGAGNDRIDIASGTATGGAGDDILYGYGSDAGPALLHGDAGNDYVHVFGAGSQGYGGAGDDFVSVNDGATGYGGDGDDQLQVESGSTAYGGDGDDLFTVWNQFRSDDGPAVVTGGTGADTFDARVWNAANGEADDIYMIITDFDPAEDILQVGVFQTSNEVDSIEIVEADDGSYTDVRVTYTALPGLAPGTAVIRLEGTTGVTADQIVITS